MVTFSYILIILAAVFWLYFRIILAKPWHNFLFVILISLIVVPNLIGIYNHPFIQQIFVPILIGMAVGDFSFRFVLWVVLKLAGEEKRNEIQNNLYNRKDSKERKIEEVKKRKEQENAIKKSQERKDIEREKKRLERLKNRK